MAYYDAMLLPILGAMFGVILLVGLAVYVYTAFALMTIAKKTKTKDPWMAWIPVLNIYLMTKIAKQPWWLLLVVFPGAAIPILGPIAAVGVTIYLWWYMCKARGKPEWYALLMLIPVVNLIMMGIVAWSE